MNIYKVRYEVTRIETYSIEAEDRHSAGQHAFIEGRHVNTSEAVRYNATEIRKVKS